MAKKKNVKGFTLIELIAVLVIMAIIALIVTPLVMNIIRSARISADKRSIDAYGRSIELAIAGYLLDTGKFPTEVSQLTIEYSGNKVECETTQINSDSSVYLSNCKVNNREVTNYTYGTDKSPSYEAYSVGDEVTYNGVDYYVIKDSGTKDNVVTLLKATPLTTEEVNLYGGVGTDNNHVNVYETESLETYSTAYDMNNYGAIQYYGSDTCNFISSQIITGCKNDYVSSAIKYVIDVWAKNNVLSSNIKEVRLLKIDEDEIETTTEEYDCCGGCGACIRTHEVIKEEWLYSEQYQYWTMSNGNTQSEVLVISSNGVLFGSTVYSTSGSTVRPIVELYKNDGITKKNSGNN